MSCWVHGGSYSSTVKTFSFGSGSSYKKYESSSSISGLNPNTNYTLECEDAGHVGVSQTFTTTGNYSIEYYVDVEDANGNPISGADVRFYTSSETSINTTQSTDSGGSASFTYTVSGNQRINTAVTESGLSCTPSTSYYDFSASNTFGYSTFTCTASQPTGNLSISHTSAPQYGTDPTLTWTMSNCSASNSGVYHKSDYMFYDLDDGSLTHNGRTDYVESGITYYLKCGTQTLDTVDFNVTPRPSGTLSASPSSKTVSEVQAQGFAFSYTMQNCSSTGYIKRRGAANAFTAVGNGSGTRYDGVASAATYTYDLTCNGQVLDSASVQVTPNPPPQNKTITAVLKDSNGNAVPNDEDGDGVADFRVRFTEQGGLGQDVSVNVSGGEASASFEVTPIAMADSASYAVDPDAGLLAQTISRIKKLSSQRKNQKRQPPPYPMYSTEGVDAIATISELRSQTSELLEHVRERKVAVLIQKNNEPYAVLLDWETYLRLTQGAETHADRTPERRSHLRAYKEAEASSSG